MKKGKTESKHTDAAAESNGSHIISYQICHCPVQYTLIRPVLCTTMLPWFSDSLMQPNADKFYICVPNYLQYSCYSWLYYFNNTVLISELVEFLLIKVLCVLVLYDDSVFKVLGNVTIQPFVANIKYTLYLLPCLKGYINLVNTLNYGAKRLCGL